MATYTEAQWLEDHKELVQARADNTDLRAALTDLLGLVTGSGDRSGSWGGTGARNPYLHSEVARAESLLAPFVNES